MHLIVLSFNIIPKVNLLQWLKAGKIKKNLEDRLWDLQEKSTRFTASAVINGNQIVDDFGHQISKESTQYCSFIHWILHLYAQRNCMHFKIN